MLCFVSPFYYILDLHSAELFFDIHNYVLDARVFLPHTLFPLLNRPVCFVLKGLLSPVRMSPVASSRRFPLFRRLALARLNHHTVGSIGAFSTPALLQQLRYEFIVIQLVQLYPHPISS